MEEGAPWGEAYSSRSQGGAGQSPGGQSAVVARLHWCPWSGAGLLHELHTCGAPSPMRARHREESHDQPISLPSLESSPAVAKTTPVNNGSRVPELPLAVAWCNGRSCSAPPGCSIQEETAGERRWRRAGAEGPSGQAPHQTQVWIFSHPSLSP